MVCRHRKAHSQSRPEVAMSQMSSTAADDGYDEIRVATVSQADSNTYNDQRQLPSAPVVGAADGHHEYDYIDPYQTLDSPEDPHGYDVVKPNSHDLPVPN